MKQIFRVTQSKARKRERSRTRISTFHGSPTKESDAPKAAAKTCSYRGPTQLSSTNTFPFESRNGKEYKYLKMCINPTIHLCQKMYLRLLKDSVQIQPDELIQTAISCNVITSMKYSLRPEGPFPLNLKPFTGGKY